MAIKPPCFSFLSFLCILDPRFGYRLSFILYSGNPFFRSCLIYLISHRRIVNIKQIFVITGERLDIDLSNLSIKLMGDRHVTRKMYYV